MNKIIFSIAMIISLLSLAPMSFAAQIEKGATVAVMDFGTHPEAVPIDINIFNVGEAANEYVIEKLVSSDKFSVMERFMVEDKIKAENLNTNGLIDPETAKKIGSLLGTKYIIYGNVNDVTLSDVSTKLGVGGVTVCTVQSHLILRMMDVETGDIVMAAKGAGKSKSSKGSVALIEVGTQKVTQESVHNALQKAAFNAVDVLIERLYGKK